MLLNEINLFDASVLWSWFLLFIRLTGVFQSLPGLGTEEVPVTFRVPLTMLLAAVITLSGAKAHYPEHVAEGILMLTVEYILGFLLGSIPGMIVAGLSLSGQVAATAIGLNQASTIDPSLGESVTTLARIQALIAVVLFLLVDGHHAVIRAAASVREDVGLFRPGMAIAEIFLVRFIHTFELAISVAAPMIVVTLLTQFVLGLLTRFVPQINVFIMSLPLTILVGLFVFSFTLAQMVRHVEKEYGEIEETAYAILANP
jgi:flagellar biosynthetic protein FliR